MRTVLLTLSLLAALPAFAQSNVAPSTAATAEVRLDGNQVLLPGEGPGWKLVDKATGKEKQIILPAFHPELSYPVVHGNRMAYVGRTQNKGKQQLGCITFDLARGKVLNRQVSSLYAHEGQVNESPQLSETENAVTCNLAGDHCTGKNLESCTPSKETISLDFEPGSLAHKDLKSSKAHRKSAHGKGKAGKRSMAAGKHAAKSGGKAASKSHGKKAGKVASHAKPASKKASHK